MYAENYTFRFYFFFPPNQTLMLSTALSEPFYHLLPRETGQPVPPHPAQTLRPRSRRPCGGGNVTVWSQAVTAWIFNVSKSNTPFNTSSACLLGNSKPRLWRTVTNGRIPFYLHILWAVLEILWRPLVLHSWSIFSKGSSRWASAV